MAELGQLTSLTIGNGNRIGAEGAKALKELGLDDKIENESSDPAKAEARRRKKAAREAREKAEAEAPSGSRVPAPDGIGATRVPTVAGTAP